MGLFFKNKSKVLKKIEDKIDSTDKKVNDLASKIDRILEENKCKLSYPTPKEDSESLKKVS